MITPEDVRQKLQPIKVEKIPLELEKDRVSVPISSLNRRQKRNIKFKRPINR